MRLHHFPLSSNARRAVMTALHLEATVELVLVDLAKGEQRAPAFLKLNPNGRVPLLEDGDLRLNESHAIMAYLCDKTPGQTLLPTDANGRADVNRWLFWNAQHLQPAVGTLSFEYFVKGFRGLGDPDPKEIARGEKLFHEFAGVLDGHLAAPENREWIAQGKLTLADYAIAASIAGPAFAKLPLADYPRVRAWFARVNDLPAWKKTTPPARA